MLRLLHVILFGHKVHNFKNNIFLYLLKSRIQYYVGTTFLISMLNEGGRYTCRLSIVLYLSIIDV